MITYAIKATHIDLTDALRKHIDEKVQTLDTFGKHIIQMRIEIGMPSMHHHKGDIFRAEANITVHGDMLRVETTHEDQYAAIDALVRMMKQSLIKHKERKH